MSVDKFLAAKFVPGRYTCHNFADDVWRDVTGKSLGEDVIKFLNDGRAFAGMRKGFQRIAKPESPCIVLCKPIGRGEHHVGVFLRGRVLHLSEMGARFQTIESMQFGYKQLRFYK